MTRSGTGAIGGLPPRANREPTGEQSQIIAGFASGRDLVIEAGAGTGKTSTLEMLSEVYPLGENPRSQRGTYIAYNRAIADEAKSKFPPNVTASTAHSMAYRAIGHRFQHRLNGQRIRSREAAQLLGIERPLMVPTVGGERPLQPSTQAWIATDTVKHFCYSGDVEIGAQHVPQVDGIAPRARDQLESAIVPYARAIWEDICSDYGQQRFEHDHYLKLWTLSQPQIPSDFVMLDEAQDANGCMSALFERQKAQKVAVGDTNQQIYSWRGSINALAKFAGEKLYLSQSFRFGPAIAAEANRWLNFLSSPLRLKGLPSIPSRLESLERADAILCRTNAEAVRQVMYAYQDGFRPSLVGGGRDIISLAQAAVQLRAGMGCSHPQLALFKTWGELQEYSQQPEGQEFRSWVKLIDGTGPETVIDAMERLSDERTADVVISTAHKAKGREWASVRLTGDFPMPQTPRWSDEEARLIYVAVTRARLVLDRTALGKDDEL